MTILVEIGHVIMDPEKKMLKYFVKVFSLFCNYRKFV